MLETHIKVLASIYTSLLIGAVASLLLFSGFKIKAPIIKGKVINATMIDISQLTKMLTPKKLKPKPPAQISKPEPEPQIPEQSKPQEKIKEIKPPEIVKKKIPIIPKKPKPTVDTKAQELERNKRIARQKKLKEIRKKRKAAEIRRKKEEQTLRDIADQRQQDIVVDDVIEDVGNKKGQSDAQEIDKLMARYQLAVTAAVERQWNKPVSASKDLLCHVKVRQIPGGGVIDATISTPCNADAIVKKSILAAIKKTDPLPYKGFEKVFDRTATFIFQPKN